MKMPQKLIAVSAALLIMSVRLPAFTVYADEIEEEEALSLPDPDENPSQETTADEETSCTPAEDMLPEETTAVETECSLPHGTEQTQEMEAETETQSDMTVPDEAPMFTAHIEYSSQGYCVKGSFSDFTPDLYHIRPLYSLDEKKWQDGIVEWDLRGPENQICLYDSHEPLKSYLSGTCDRFFLKLRLTMKNELTYETQTAVIDRGEPQPIPENVTPAAIFAPSIRLIDRNPFRVYGKYQITVRADSSAKDAAAHLPDTLPVEVQLPLQNDVSHTAICAVDCPVSWKPLSVTLPAAGESVTVPDAANELVIPAGTLLKTPLGIFRLDEPLPVEQDNIHTDEVRLVLNAVSEDGNPTGVLAATKNLLELSFHLKPTGAAAIQAYTLTKGDSKWKEIHGHALSEAVNAQPSTANSGYAAVLDSSQEPYRSYQAAVEAGNDPVPFFIGLKIKGGVYDGRQLVLAWPADYDLPPALPEVGGSGGNHGNAGSDNKDDGTDEGQRPSLPQNPEREPDAASRTDLPPNSAPLQNLALNQDVAAATEPYTDEAATATPASVQTTTDNMTAEPSIAAGSITNTEPDIPTKTVIQPAPSTKAKVSSVTPPPDKNTGTDSPEKPIRNSKNSGNYLPLALAAAAVAYLVLSIRRTNKK